MKKIAEKDYLELKDKIPIKNIQDLIVFLEKIKKETFSQYVDKNKNILKQVYNPIVGREYFLKGEVSGEIYSTIEDELNEETVDKNWHILCAECSQAITGDSECIEVNGAHEHTFVNPSGIIFQISCFAKVSGTNISCDATEQWSWFKGYSWRIVCCGRCGTHLGWVYMACDEIIFYGLILSRLLKLN